MSAYDAVYSLIILCMFGAVCLIGYVVVQYARKLIERTMRWHRTGGKW